MAFSARELRQAGKEKASDAMATAIATISEWFAVFVDGREHTRYSDVEHARSEARLMRDGFGAKDVRVKRIRV